MRRRNFKLIVTLALLAPAAAGAQPPAAGGPAAPMNPMAPTSAAGSTAPQYPREILGDGLDEWVKRLESRDAGVRELAVRTVPLFGPPAVKHLPKLIDKMGDPDYGVKLAALQVATSNPVEDKKQQDEIASRLDSLSFLGNDQASMRIQSAQAVGRIGPAMARGTVIATLAGNGHLRFSRSYEVRKAAAEALGQVGRPSNPNDPQSGPNQKALLALLGQHYPGTGLTDPCLAVRIEVVQSLILLGRPLDPKDIDAEKGILLQRITDEKDPALSLWLRVCLMRLEAKWITDKNLEPLAAALRDRKHHVRVNAAQALAIMGPEAASKAGALRVGLEFAKSTKPEDLEFLFHCVVAIGRMGKEAGFLKEELRPLTAHADPAIKEIAKEALGLLEGKKAGN